MSTKEFPIGAVLSVVTGVLVSEDPENAMGGVYEVLNWMTGESVYTHQIPRISREAEPVILAFHPVLRQAVEEAGQVTPDNWRTWLETWTARYGKTITVPKMTIAEHERIDPLSELAENLDPSRIAVIGIDPGKPGDDRS